MAEASARNFPVVREMLGHADAIYGFKSGFDRKGLALGLKAGGYWPGNVKRGLSNHQSTVFLFDPDTGKCQAMIGGNLLTALRTAAAAAVSVARLARTDSRVLGIVGAGHQAAFQLRAVAEQRKFAKVLAWNRSIEKLDRLAAVARELGLEFSAVTRDALAAQCDVIITITSSAEALLRVDQIRPGTHLSCMGTDTPGKLEVDPALVARASLFTDERAQAITIGECQHAVAQGLVAADAITELGQVIVGKHPGRRSADEITLFDGTGVALQDLAVAAAILQRAKKPGQGH